MRALVSAELDGELSDFESSLMRAHLGGCAACSAFERDAARFTDILREEPLHLMDTPIVVQQRRRLGLQAVRMPAVAALAVSAIALGTLFETLHSRSVVTQRSFSPSAQDLARDSQAIRRYQTSTAFAQLRRVSVPRARFTPPNSTPSLNPPPL
jgi:predicted anti-sigma-YlaC factor YlaD